MSLLSRSEKLFKLSNMMIQKNRYKIFELKVFETFMNFLFQEEGWLMGMKESTGQKGLFPANFTKPI